MFGKHQDTWKEHMDSNHHIKLICSPTLPEADYLLSALTAP